MWDSGPPIDMLRQCYVIIYMYDSVPGEEYDSSRAPWRPRCLHPEDVLNLHGQIITSLCCYTESKCIDLRTLFNITLERYHQ